MSLNGQVNHAGWFGKLHIQYWDQTYWKHSQRLLFQRALTVIRKVDREIHSFGDNKSISDHIARLDVEIDKLKRSGAFLLQGP